MFARKFRSIRGDDDEPLIAAKRAPVEPIRGILVTVIVASVIAVVALIVGSIALAIINSGKFGSISVSNLSVEGKIDSYEQWIVPLAPLDSALEDLPNSNRYGPAGPVGYGIVSRWFDKNSIQFLSWSLTHVTITKIGNVVSFEFGTIGQSDSCAFRNVATNPGPFIVTLSPDLLPESIFPVRSFINKTSIHAYTYITVPRGYDSGYGSRVGMIQGPFIERSNPDGSGGFDGFWFLLGAGTGNTSSGQYFWQEWDFPTNNVTNPNDYCAFVAPSFTFSLAPTTTTQTVTKSTHAKKTMSNAIVWGTEPTPGRPPVTGKP